MITVILPPFREILRLSVDDLPSAVTVVWELGRGRAFPLLPVVEQEQPPLKFSLRVGSFLLMLVFLYTVFFLLSLSKF